MMNSSIAAPWTVDDLLDGDPLIHGHGPLEHVWRQLHAHLTAGHADVVAAFCDIVRRRPSVIGARLVALHLAQDASGPLAELVDELLVSDRRLYAHHRGSKLVSDAIQARWTVLDARQRAAVMESIEYCENASPSFAYTRSLIAAIPEHDRNQQLQELLVVLGGPPPSEARDSSKTIVARPEAKEPPTRSIAERIADVPTWLSVDPIPWNRVASILYEEEHARKTNEDKSPRILAGETARQCADSAITAIESFSSSSLSDNEREDVLRVADMCLAHPQMANDDAANARLISALRTGVFQPPLRRDVAIHALSFMRPWHWRSTQARELTLEVINSEADPAIVTAAIQPLYRAGIDAIIAGARSLAAVNRTNVDERTAEQLGHLMGGAGLFLIPAGAEELNRWLEMPPRAGVLRTAEALKEYLSGIAFTMKEAAHNDEVDPGVYATWAAKIWKNWRVPELTKIEGKGSIALFLMSPLQEWERGKRVAAKYWAALRPLFEEIVNSHDSNEVYSALFDLDVAALLPIALKELVFILQLAARSQDSVDKGLNSEGRIAQVLCKIASHNLCDRAVASEIHQTLLAVGARKEALEVERKWRDRDGL